MPVLLLHHPPSSRFLLLQVSCSSFPWLLTGTSPFWLTAVYVQYVEIIRGLSCFQIFHSSFFFHYVMHESGILIILPCFHKTQHVWNMHLFAYGFLLLLVQILVSNSISSALFTLFLFQNTPYRISLPPGLKQLYTTICGSYPAWHLSRLPLYLWNTIDDMVHLWRCWLMCG